MIFGRIARLWDRLPFTGRLLFTASFALLVAGLLMLHASARQDAEHARDDLSRMVADELEVLPFALSEPVVVGDFSTLEQTLNRFARRPNITFIRYQDTSGTVISAHGQPMTLHAPAFFDAWTGLGDLKGVAPVEVGGRRYGLLEIGLTARPAINRAWTRLLGHLSILGLAILLDFLGIWLVLRTGLAPLQDMDDGAARLAAGDYATRIAPRGSPELRRSIAAFNHMARSVEESLRTIEHEKHQLSEHQERLEQIAHYDTLTGLPNRALLADRMRVALAQADRGNHLLAVAFLDLDGFKPVNDAFGHQTGDRLLVEVAGRLTASVRGGDTVARLGGDEFILILSNVSSLSECERTLTRLLRAVAEPYGVGGGAVVHISASIGVTLYPDDSEDADTLLRHADQAMYLAKETGRNRYHLYDPDRDRQARAHREILVRVEQALAAGQFCLHYQPKVNLRLGIVAGMEALIRWQDPERGLVAPGEFIRLVDDSELAAPLGEWVIREALAQISAWRDEGLTLPVSVNVSARHLEHPDFVPRLQEFLAAHPELPAGSLELEVLETAALEDVEQVSRIMAECQSLGVGFALDDFGTGYSSLIYFRRLPARTLKIDQSFVRDMLRNPEDLAIVEGIIGLTDAFHRIAVAEGVETEEQGVMLLHMGCEFAQGYAIARPMPDAGVAEWVRNWRIDPVFMAAAGIDWRREDLPLLFAELYHRRWIEQMACLVRDAPLDAAAPPLDHHECRLGGWLAGEGGARYGHLPEFHALSLEHDRAHDLAAEALSAARSGHTDVAQARLSELFTCRDELLTALRRLQTTVVLG